MNISVNAVGIEKNKNVEDTQRSRTKSVQGPRRTPEHSVAVWNSSETMESSPLGFFTLPFKELA